MNKDANKGQAPTHLQRAGDGKKGEREREREGGKRGGEERWGREREREISRERPIKGQAPTYIQKEQEQGRQTKTRANKKRENQNEQTREREDTRENRAQERRRERKNERERDTHPARKGGAERKPPTRERGRDSDRRSNRHRNRTRQTGTDLADSLIRTKQTTLGPFLERSNGGRSPEFLIRLEFPINLIKLVPCGTSLPGVIMEAQAMAMLL